MFNAAHKPHFFAFYAFHTGPLYPVAHLVLLLRSPLPNVGQADTHCWSYTVLFLPPDGSFHSAYSCFSRCYTRTLFMIYAVYRHAERNITLSSGQPAKKYHLVNCVHSCSLAEEQLNHIHVTIICCKMKGCPAVLHMKTIKASNAAPLPQCNTTLILPVWCDKLEDSPVDLSLGTALPNMQIRLCKSQPSKWATLVELLCHNYTL